ncbi:unnamed protein product, partial [Rotaria sordida]
MITWNLTYNKIGPIGVFYLGETVTTLNISGNNIKDKGVEYLADILRCNKTLTTLSLSDCGLEASCTQRLADALRTNNTLTKLVLGRSKIGIAGAKYIAAALRNNKTLKQFELSGNHGDCVAIGVTVQFRNDRTLTTLDLRQNQIESTSVKYIADIIRTTTSLTTLDLDFNTIRDDGVKYLADALQINEILTTLDLSQNDISPRGIQYVADVLRKNSGLQSLYLQQNAFGVVGGQHLVGSLRIKLQQNNTNINIRKYCEDIDSYKECICILYDEEKKHYDAICMVKKAYGQEEIKPFQRDGATFKLFCKFILEAFN